MCLTCILFRFFSLKKIVETMALFSVMTCINITLRNIPCTFSSLKEVSKFEFLVRLFGILRKLRYRSNVVRTFKNLIYIIMYVAYSLFKVWFITAFDMHEVILQTRPTKFTHRTCWSKRDLLPIRYEIHRTCHSNDYLVLLQ